MRESREHLLVVADGDDTRVCAAASGLGIPIARCSGVAVTPGELARARIIVVCGAENARALGPLISIEHGAAVLVAALREGEDPERVARCGFDDFVALDAPRDRLAARLRFALARSDRKLDPALGASPLTEIVDVIDELVAITSGDGRTNLYLSPAFDTLTGTPRASIMEDTFQYLRLVPAEDHAILVDAFAHKDVPWEYQYRLVRPDGQTRWLHSRAFPVRNPDGSTARIVTITRDVTERRRAEADAEAQRALLAGVTTALTTLLEAARPSESIDAALGVLGPAALVDRAYVARHSRDASGVLSVALTHEWTSEGTPRLLGRPEVSGLLPAPPAAAQMIERVERGPSLQILFSELPPPVQQRLEGSGALSLLVVPIQADGQPWGHLGFVDCHTERRWDASARKIVEATAAALGSAIMRERAMDALAEQVDRIRSLYEAAANPAMTALDQVQRLLEAGARLLDVEQAAAIRILSADDRTCEIAYVHPTDATMPAGSRVPLDPDLWEGSSARLEVGRLAFLGAPIWVRGQRWGGLALSSAAPRDRPFRDTDADLARLIARGLAHLVEQIDSENERRALDASLRETQKLESLGLLAGGIAHDFNNLLMAIVGNAALAQRAAGRESPPLHEALEQITAAARRAADLTRQLVAYAGRGQYRIQATSLAALVSEISSLLAVVLPEDSQLELDLDPELPAVLGDVAQLQQIVMNLITNAGDSLEGRPGTIRVRAYVVDLVGARPRARFVAEDAPAGRYVVLEVADSGVGMEAETLEHMFEPFFTTKQTGRGLGLAAALGVVRAHRGAIDVESTPRRGTTFRVFLPAADGPVPVVPPRAPHDAIRLEARVLVADDTEAVRAALQRILEAHGAEVVTACDGVEAIEIVEREGARLDAAVLDLSMPRMDGWHAHLRIRELAPELPALVISGYSDADRVRVLLERPRTAFLQKPFGGAELVTRVHALIDRCSRERGAR